MMVGGHSELKTDADGLASIFAFQDIIEEFLGLTFETFEPIAYTTQVVAGTVYQAKIRVDGGEVIHAKIFEPLPHTNEAPSIMDAQTGFTEDDFIDFN